MKTETQFVYRGQILCKRQHDPATGNVTPWEPCPAAEQAKFEADHAAARAKARAKADK